MTEPAFMQTKGYRDALVAGQARVAAAVVASEAKANKGPTVATIELVAREMARGTGGAVEAFLVPALALIEEAFATGRRHIRITPNGFAEVCR